MTQIHNRIFFHISVDLAFRALSDSCKKFKNSEKAALKQFMEKLEKTFENLVQKQTIIG